MGLLCSAPALRSGLEKEKMMFFPFCYFQSYISPDFRLVVQILDSIVQILDMIVQILDSIVQILDAYIIYIIYNV